MSTNQKFVVYEFFSILATFLSAFALMRMWAWFVVPTFDLPILSFPVALGLMFMVELFGSRSAPNFETLDVGQTAFLMLFIPITLLGVGWIVHLFV